MKYVKMVRCIMEGNEMAGQRVGAACSPEKVGSSKSRLRRGAGVAVRWGAGFKEESVGRRPPCYLNNLILKGTQP